MLSAMRESDDTENRTDGTHMIPSAISAARETPCGFLPTLFREGKAVIQAEFCTSTLHNSYTAKFAYFRVRRINTF
jgi:hypothetical protein